MMGAGAAKTGSFLIKEGNDVEEEEEEDEALTKKGGRKEEIFFFKGEERRVQAPWMEAVDISSHLLSTKVGYIAKFKFVYS